jgi:Immunoglobulin domain
MKYLACLCVWLVGAIILPCARANVYNVTGTADAAGTVTSLGGGNFNASSLRAAVNAANTAGGANTINIPPGTYTLSLGELPVGTLANTSFTINGTGTPANTIIQHDTNSPVARVFDLDTNLLGGVSVSILNVTIGYGRNNDGTGGAGIISGFEGPPAVDTTSISNCVFLDNEIIGTNDAVGGGIQNVGGTLTVYNSAFNQNAATNFSGGAIYYNSHTPIAGTFQVSNSQFSNNVCGDIADGGGAIFVFGASNSVLSINNSTFVSNRVTSVNGNGGAIIKFGAAPLNITECTFLNNRVLGNSGTANNASGGAIDNAGGPMTIQFCRLFGNSTFVSSHGNAINNDSGGGATLNATNNWWGLNTGPAAGDLIGATAPVWLQLDLTANPSTVNVGNSTTFTATFLTNSAGTFIPVANLGVLLGLPITFSNAVLGTLSSPQAVIQPSGTATSTFTASFPGTGSINAAVDNGVATGFVNIPCLPVSGSVSGGGGICPGNSALVTVSLSGGFAPYTVILNNGGGTSTGPSPVSFFVSPTSNTTYSVSSATDKYGCPASVSGSATVSIITLSPPAITPNPPTVINRSSGNEASGPSGYAGYAWTIANGTIVGPANTSTITYTAGLYDSVTLGLTVTNGSGCSGSNSIAVPVVVQPVTSFGCDLRTNYFSSMTFTDEVPFTPTGIAFDGTNYWACSGSGPSGIRLGRYDVNGVLLTNYSPGLDFRSVFVGSTGVIFARAYDDPVIYRQTSPGVFVNSGVSLTGGPLNYQSQVILNGAGTEYDSMSNGIVSRWSLTGAYLGNVTLQGYGVLAGETVVPYSRALAAAGDLWVTYTYGANSVLSVWDASGARLGQAVLSGAGGNNPGWSFSYCNGKAFISDGNPGFWHAFDVCDGARVAVFGASSLPNGLSDVQTKVTSLGSIPQVDAFSVIGGTVVPGLADFQKYESVLVFGDVNYNDPTNIGNALTSYIDLGGGVIVATFSYDQPPGLGLGGQIATNNYMAFTTTNGQSEPGGLTMIEDLPTHPLLDGVVTFGGGADYHNSPITNTPGSLLVAHWSDGQPLVGGKDDPPGRAAGLNFYPASSDALSGLWDPATDGAKMIANAFLWSGKIPPTISSSPTSQVASAGAHVTFQATAAGTPPLSYQWYFNGTNIAGATSNVFSVTVQTNTVGPYRVIVSNPYGESISPAVSLNPPIHFLQPIPSGSVLTLFLANLDGSPVTADEAARIELFTTTDPSQPFSSWTPAAYPMVITNGLLRVDGVPLSGSRSFFRALLTP